MTTAHLSAVQTNLVANAADLGAVLAAMTCLPDTAHASLPDEWRDLLANLTTLIADTDMTAQEVADDIGLPGTAVQAFAVGCELV